MLTPAESINLPSHATQLLKAVKDEMPAARNLPLDDSSSYQEEYSYKVRRIDSLRIEEVWFHIIALTLVTRGTITRIVSSGMSFYLLTPSWIGGRRG